MIKNVAMNDILRTPEPSRSAAAPSNGEASFAEALHRQGAARPPVAPKSASAAPAPRKVKNSEPSTSTELGVAAAPPRTPVENPAEADVEKAAAAIVDEFDGASFKKIERPERTAKIDASARPPAAGVASTDSASVLDDVEAFRDGQAEIKQKSIENFMGQMQAQFGVTPAAIVQAFGKMDQATLLAPPEDAKVEFLDALGLPPSPPARAQAGKLYDEMAKVTGEAMRNEKVASVALGEDDEMAGPTFVDDRGSLTPVKDSLDELTVALAAMAAAVPSRPAGPVGPATEAVEIQPNRAQGADAKTKADPVALAPAALPPVPATELPATGLAATMALPIRSTVEPVVPGDASDENAEVTVDKVEQPRVAATTDARLARPTAAPAEARGSSAFKNPYSSKAKAEEAAVDAKRTSAVAETPTSAPSIGQSVGQSVAAPTDAPSANPPAAAAAPPAVGGATGWSAGATAGLKATKAEADANVQEILRQAQLIAKKGGGEMKMELRPEGLGQVNLRVSVQDGLVSVQMVTQTDDAKRLLESNLHELKSGLGAHKLQLDGLRIESHDGIQKQMDQGRSESQRESARQFAGDSMAGTRDQLGNRGNRDSFRQAFEDGQAIRGYKGAPRASGDELARAAARSQSSRRLNLVA